MEESGRAFKIIIGKPTGNRHPGKLRCRCEGNNRIILKKQVSVRGIRSIGIRIRIL